MRPKNGKKPVFSTQTRNNILLDMSLLLAGLAAVLSGIYFLFLPVGGYQGGRNPYYGLVILFERHTWSDVHLWTSLALIVLAALHIPLHWDRIVKMTRSGARTLIGNSKLNPSSLSNLGINILVGLSGLVCALSGIYFLFEPALLALSPGGWLFSRLAWDLIHTWSGVIVTAAAILHFAIHWRWIVKVLSKYRNAVPGTLAGRGEKLADPAPSGVEKAS